ncbi:MAG: hypothetical protein LBQ60_11480, partial [Bacteroidales bacterium]|nr:hypothetical protein [Bacteroidales bacterium]
MKKIALFILYIYFQVNLMAQTPITVNELFDHAVTINYAGIPTSIEIDFHDGSMPPVAGDNNLLGISGYDYHARVFKVNLAEGEKLRVYCDNMVPDVYFFKKNNGVYVSANALRFQTSSQIEGTGEYYIVITGEYGQDFEKTTLTLDLPHHFYTVAELYEQATNIAELPFNESGEMEERNSFIVAGGTDGIGYQDDMYLVRPYKFSIDTDESVLLSYSIKNSFPSYVYIFAENAGQFKLIGHHTNGISKKRISQPGNYLVFTMVYCSHYPYGFNYTYSFEAESMKTPASLEECAEGAEKIETLPYSLTAPVGNGLQSSFMDIYGSYYHGKAFKVQIGAGKAIRVDFNSEETNASFSIYYKSGNNLLRTNAYVNTNSLSYSSAVNREYIIFMLTDQPLETIGFTLNITETEAPGTINELYESAIPVNYNDMPFSLNGILGTPPSRFVVDGSSWINAQAFKVTMTAKERIRINLTGADVKVYLKENGTYNQTYDYSGNVLYASKNDDYYVVVSSGANNGNVDFSLKIDHITELNSLEDVLSEAKPLNTLPSKIQGVLNEQSNIVDRDHYVNYATAYRLCLKAGTAARIKEGYDHNATVTAYQKIDDQYQLISNSYYYPIVVPAGKTDDYYILVSSNGLQNDKYDLNITETAIPINYKGLIDATQSTTTLPFVGSGTLNNEHASLLKGNSSYCYFSNAYKVSLEAGTVLEYNLTSDVEKYLYIYDSQTYHQVHFNDAVHGSYLIPQSGNYHIIVSAKSPLDEGDYTLKLRAFTTIPIETLLENASSISLPASFTDVLGGESEPCVKGNDFTDMGNYYFAKAYKLHLTQGEDISIKAVSDFLYPNVSLARKNLRGEFVQLITGTRSLKYQAKESGDYYLIISSTYNNVLTSGDFTLSIQPFTYSTLDDLLDNAGELLFNEDHTCFVTGRKTDPIQKKIQYSNNYYYYTYNFAQAYKVNLEVGTHLLAQIQSSGYMPLIELYKENGDEYQKVTGNDNPNLLSLIDESGEYYVVVSVSDYHGNFENSDFSLSLKIIVPITIDDLCANATELSFPGSVLVSFEKGNSPCLFSNGYYRSAQAYKINLTAKTNIIAIISSLQTDVTGNFDIYVKKENTYELMSYGSSWKIEKLDAGEYYFIVHGSAIRDDRYILKVDKYTEESSLDELFKNAPIIDGQKDLPYVHFCDFTKSSVPVVQLKIQPNIVRTSKVKAFRLKNFSSERYQIEFASNMRQNCELYLYEKDGSEYVLIDKKNSETNSINSALIPSSGKEYMVLVDVNLYAISNDIYRLKITDTDAQIPASKILDIKLEGGHHIQIPSTFTEEDVKELLVNKKVIPKVNHNEITPAIRNSVSCWTVNPTLTQATGLFEAPEGYQFSDGTGTIVVDFNSP